VREYCDATCRSAARRARRTTSSVNTNLTQGARKGDIDGVDGVGPARLMDAVGRLTAAMSAGDESPLEAVVAARDLARCVEGAMRASVERARDMGHTWQEIGEVLGTSRQAAFQRFGRPLDPRTGTPMADRLPPDAGARAATLVACLTDGRWDDVCRDFDETVAARLDATGVAAVWAQVVGMAGGYEGMGEPLARQAGDYTVVDVPLRFEGGDRAVRVTFDRRGKVAGLFVLPADSP
jgi:hypothetical protein